MKEKGNKSFWDRWAGFYDRFMHSNERLYDEIAGKMKGSLNWKMYVLELLAYIFAFFFNVPCIAAMGGAFQEIHSWKWTVRIILYYIAVALLMSTIAYHIGLFVF